MVVSCNSQSSSEMFGILELCVVGIPGLFMSTFTIKCLVQISLAKNKAHRQDSSNMFNYLLVKAISDLSIFLIAVSHIVFLASSTLRFSLMGSMWMIYFQNYALPCLFYVSSLLEMAATLDCLILFWDKLKWLISKTAFYIITTSILIFSFTFHIYIFWQLSIEEVRTVDSENKTQITYRPKYEPFRFSQVSLSLIAAESFIRDVLFLVVLVLINILILVELRRITKRKINLETDLSDSSNTRGKYTNASRPIQMAMNAETNKARMTVAIGANYFLGHSLYAVYQIATSLGVNPGEQPSWFCVYRVGLDLILLSYGSSFLINFSFNYRFREIAKENFKQVIDSLSALFTKL